MIRSAGVLMPLFSLPGPFGTGVFGPEALDFAKAIHEAGFTRWLVLPFSPPGFGDSPYQALSSFAGNPAFIDLRPLYEEGLLSLEELEDAYCEHRPIIDYERANAAHAKALGLAFDRLKLKDLERLLEYTEAEAAWLDDYCIFMAAKAQNNLLPWWEWKEEGLRKKDPMALLDYRKSHGATLLRFAYEQFLFQEQWSKLKAEINDLGVQIIGDLPIYPAADSADLWGARHRFETDAQGRLLRVAGVPPDYFSRLGQRWGNPLYRWDLLKEEGYAYWLERIGRNLEWYDMLRLDHFRGFESYWAVPAEEATAVHGCWEKGPGMDLFQVLLRTFPGSAIVAEDLGDIDANVRQFLAETGLPGMKVLQFSLDPQSKDRPHSFECHQVVFTGTHDNDTSLGWARSLSEAQWDFVRDYFDLEDDAKLEEGPKNPLSRAMVRCLLQSVADLALVPIQDLLGQGSAWRINTPGSLDGNWKIRYSQEDLEALDLAYWKRQSLLAQRSEA